MPFYERDGARIHYSEHGDPSGPPVLLIAPGGMRSAEAMWGHTPFDPRERTPSLRLVAMDQRNAGHSSGPVHPGSGWHTYTADQLGLMDHLGIDSFQVIGMCIGGAYIMGLLRAAPMRVRSAVMLQPIGLHDNREAFYALFDRWAESLAVDHPDTSAATWRSFREAMFGGDFLFNASRAELSTCTTPLLLMPGDDKYHPASISAEVAALAPNLTRFDAWKDPSRTAAVDEAVRTFLHNNR